MRQKVRVLTFSRTLSLTCLSLMLVVVGLFGKWSMYLCVVYRLHLVAFAFVVCFIKFFHAHDDSSCSFCILFLILNDVPFLDETAPTKMHLLANKVMAIFFSNVRLIISADKLQKSKTIVDGYYDSDDHNANLILSCYFLHPNLKKIVRW